MYGKSKPTLYEMEAPTTATDSPPTVNALTVLFNAVEIANRRGAYSLKESAMISRALDAVRQVNPESEEAPADAPEAAEAPEAPEPTIA